MENPKIRFKGFTKDWEQRKVTDLGEIYIGLVTTMTEHYTDKGHLLIRNSDIKDGYFEFGENPIYLDEEFSEQNKSRMHRLGDVITVHTGDIGTSAVIGENEVNSIGFATIVTRPNQEILDSNYFATYLNTDTNKQWAVSMATGDGRSNYNLKDYTKLIVPIPEIEEQKKIAASIVNLNTLITLHQRKCEQTKNLKKYMLQKMFPQNGAKVPEIRFDGFTYDWEQRKVLDLLELLTDYDANGSFADMAKNVNTTDGDGYAWYVRITDLENPKPLSELKYVDESSYKFLKNTELHGGELLMAKRGEIGKVYIFEPRTRYATVAPNMYLLKLNDKVIPHFLYDYFVSEEGNKKLTRLNASSTMGALYKDDVKNIDVIIPSIEEQDMIGNFFQSIDHLITLHQRQHKLHLNMLL